MKRSIFLFAMIAFIAPECYPQSLKEDGRDHSVKPKDGFVPDKATAIAVAEAVLFPIYGVDQVRDQRPFSASLKDKMWLVSGQLEPGKVGGVAEVIIEKKSGRIVSVTHGK